MTKMHCDLSDAVNIMMHQRGGGMGATIRYGDVPADPEADPRWVAYTGNMRLKPRSNPQTFGRVSHVIPNFPIQASISYARAAHGYLHSVAGSSWS